MGARLFGRVCSVQVDTVEVSGLRTVFHVTRTASIEPNTATVEVYNLAPSTRSAMARRGAPLVLTAGYEGTAAAIFRGDVLRCTTSRSGPDVVTRIEAGDGALVAQTATTDASFAAGAKIDEVVDRLLRDLGTDPRAAVAKLRERVRAGELRAGLTEFVKGYLVSGSTVKALANALGQVGLEASIQDGKVQILATNEALGDDVVILRPDTGLVGTPRELEAVDVDTSATTRPGGVEVRCLLQPSIVPGRRVVLDDVSRLGGEYRAMRVVHAGDTHGADWTTTAECELLGRRDAPVAGVAFA